jgi:hypothetical protein
VIQNPDDLPLRVAGPSAKRHYGSAAIVGRGNRAPDKTTNRSPHRVWQNLQSTPTQGAKPPLAIINGSENHPDLSLKIDFAPSEAGASASPYLSLSVIKGDIRLHIAVYDHA